MARCPFAVWRPLPENGSQSHIDPTQAILHSAVDAPGPTSLYGYFGRSDVVLESHFFVKLDGTIEQYIDTTVRADANRDANERAISIETEDEGNPDARPWNDAQRKAIVRLLDWICRTHPKVARSTCKAWDAPGIGWHSMWGAPSRWTPVAGKTCPGKARIAQCPSIIRDVAALAAPQPGGFMSDLTEAEQREILQGIRLLTPFAPEKINRAGEITQDGVDADPSVRWAIQTLNWTRRSSAALRTIVKQEIAAAAADGGVDPEVVADRVIQALGKALAT